MTIDSFDVVFYTAIFVLPGFIVSNIIDSINPPKKHNDSVYFLKCLMFSLINCAVWSWLYKIVLESKELSLWCHWILLVAISVVGSAMIGFVVAIFKKLQIVKLIFSLFKINTIHSTPTAWDYLFSKPDSRLVVITLMDDSKLCGWYSSDSFTSSDSEERDIYVEIAYRILDDGKLVIKPESQGFYVPKGQIKYIELIKTGE